MDIEDLKYPVGKYSPPSVIDKEQRDKWITELEEFPAVLSAECAGLSDDVLDTRYRPDGWTVRQVVHHLVDSHINSYIRYKWTLTEDSPLIKAYDESLWAELPEASGAPVDLSLNLLKALHIRWTLMLRNMDERQWKRKFHHPETDRDVILDWNLGMYAWHCRHHLAHIRLVTRRS